MSDLRDRIAAVLRKHRPHRREWTTCTCDGHFSHFTDETWEWHVADAVIAELGLKPVETLDRRYVRWATKWRNNPDWKADDE